MIETALLLLVFIPIGYCGITFLLTSLISGGWGPGGAARNLQSLAREIFLQYRVFLHAPGDWLRPAWSSSLAGDGDLVVLVPGFSETDFIFRRLGDHLARAGFRFQVYKYNTLTGDLAVESARLAAWVAAHPVNRVHFVGHSMGGVLVRHLVEQHGVTQLGGVVTIASPRGGTALGRAIPGRYGRQIQPGSHFLAELADKPDYRLLNIWSAHDSIVAPRSAARLNERDVQLTSGLCHNSQLFSPEVLHLVSDYLRTPCTIV